MSDRKGLRPHPRHRDGPCPAYDPASPPGKGPAEIRAELVAAGLIEGLNS